MLFSEDSLCQLIKKGSFLVRFEFHPSSLYRTIPLLDCTPTHHRKTSAYTRGLDSLSSCLDAMFQSKIIEARKYIPSVIQALKSGILSDVLVPALVDRFLQYGTLLNSEQFDLIVKLLNSALVDQHSALMLLPLTTIIYRVRLGGREGGRERREWGGSEGEGGRERRKWEGSEGEGEREKEVGRK